MVEISKSLCKELYEYDKESNYYKELSNEALINGLQSVAYMLKVDGVNKKDLLDGLYTILVLMERVEEE